MQGIYSTLEILMILVATIVLVGLYKPWVVLWWSDFANRLKVLKIYGTWFVCSLLLYVLLRLWVY